MAVPIAVRHGYISALRVASAASNETSSRQCALRWQITNASMTRALVSRRLPRQVRRLQVIAARSPPRVGADHTPALAMTASGAFVAAGVGAPPLRQGLAIELAALGLRQRGADHDLLRRLE